MVIRPRYEPLRESYPCASFLPDGTSACDGNASLVMQIHLWARRDVFHCFVCGLTWNTAGDPVDKFSTWAKQVALLESKGR